MTVLEIVRFASAPGVDEEQMLTAWKGSLAFAAAQPGFIARKLAHEGEGRWVDLVEWSSMDEAKAAMGAFDPAKWPDLAVFMQAMQPDSFEISHVAIHGTTA